MRLRPSLPFKYVARNYATRRPVKPPTKIADPLLNSRNADVVQLPEGTTFIHRPPPTAPSPFSTTLQPASPLLRPSTSTVQAPMPSEQTGIAVPPRMRKEREFPDNRVLTENDFKQMRQLREANPTYWTRIRVAKKFKCPPFLVAQKAPLDNEHKRAAVEKIEMEHEKIRSSWGEQKSMVMAIQRKRREFW